MVIALKNDRLFQLLYLLLERRASTAPELAQLLEVSVRTVYRDLDALSMAGVPVCTMPGKGGGVSLMPGYSFDKTMLSDDEQNQVLFAIQSLRAADQEVGALLTKLGSVFQKPDANWIEVDFSRWGLRRTDSVKFDLIKRAVLEHRVLKLRYCGASGESTQRYIKPFKLIFKDKSWYVQAFCLKAEDFRLFKVGRMQELILMDEQFADDFSTAPRIEAEPPPMAVMYTLRLRFSKAVAFRVYDEFDVENIQREPSGSLLVSATFPLDGWAFGYLLSFGTGIEIIAPEEMRVQVAAYAKEIYQHHQNMTN